MQFVFCLIGLGFLSPPSLWRLLLSKIKHGRNLSFLLQYAALRYGPRTALSDGTRRLSFREQYDAVLQLSKTIDNKIENRDEAVIILACRNQVNHILTLYAIKNLGVKLVVVNPKSSAADVQKIAERKQGMVYVFSSEAEHLLLKNALNIDELPLAAAGKKMFSKKSGAVVFPTSGTTGTPKLITKKNGSLYWLRSFADLVMRTGLHRKNSVYISTPVSHMFGYSVLLFSAVLGKKVVISTGKDAQWIAQLLQREKVDLLTGVPASLYRIAGYLQRQRHHIDLIISNGAPFSQITLNKVSSSISRNIFSLYGSTEASASFVADYPSLSKNATAIGTPLAGVRYRLHPLPGGGLELLIKSPMININSSSWLRTGDLISAEHNGDLSWRGRMDDMIIRNGVNIYPVEIESELLQMEGIEDVIVCGEYNAVMGQSIIAYIKLKPGMVLPENNIRALPGMKRPDRIEVVNEIQYSDMGKKLKPD